MRCCLIERLSLKKERDNLDLAQYEMINPRMYIDNLTRLAVIKVRLNELECELARLGESLRFKLSILHIPSGGAQQ